MDMEYAPFHLIDFRDPWRMEGFCYFFRLYDQRGHLRDGAQ